MGTIRTEVRDQHLSQFPREEDFLKAFLPGFYITWGRRRHAHNTEISVYFLNPEPFITDAFGIEMEVMLAYSPYLSMEPRSVQAVEAFFNDAPAKGRVEKLVYFFISEDSNVTEWFGQYATENQETRLVIPLFVGDLIANANDAWFIRNKITAAIYGRDLFDLRLPLEHDISFFGRADLVLSLHSSVKRSENRGIFGLRKTGKTSLLFKLERLLKADGTAKVFYYDCKVPSIRKSHWNELLAHICRDICDALHISMVVSSDAAAVDRDFQRLVKQLPQRVLLVFDEIEYISPMAVEDKHWHQEFITFWQAIWSVQSKERKICTLIAGVNPSVVEIDAINGVQNPLFGIVAHQYLKGLSIDETRVMVRTLGRRMGLKFTEGAVQYLQTHYGGHPLLTRIACSILNSQCRERGLSRPIEVTESLLKRDESQRDEELVFYCRHVVSELKQFYLDEYEMLELISCGQLVDFMELDHQLGTTKHLADYGLLGRTPGRVPNVAIPVIARFVALEHARRTGRRTLAFITASTDRNEWLERRKEAILHDFRLLETATRASGTIQSLFGVGGIPEADKFVRIEVVHDAATFEKFINVCNRCLVESVENHGASVGKLRFFWEDVKTSYPELQKALLRVKIYRHENFHIQLTGQASAELLSFLASDLDGKSVSSFTDGYFILQQCVLDSLLSALQVEMSTYT